MNLLRGPTPAPRSPETLTLHGVLEDVSRRYPDHEALVFDDPLLGGSTVRWTYADLAARSRRVAAGLVAAGLGKGTRIGLLLGNRPEAVAAIFGVSMAGGVVVPLSTFSTPSELAYPLRHSDIALLITQRRLLSRDFPADIARLAAETPYLERVVVVGSGSWEEFLADGDQVDAAVADGRAAGVAPADHALIIYTSGTTEVPKGILHTHGATALQFWQQAELFGRGPGTRMWTALPVFWTAGFNTAMGSTVAAGGCWVMQETFEPAAALALMERERVTEPYTLPHQTAALEEDPGWVSTDLSSLRCVYGKSAFARHPKVHGDTSWSMPVGYGLSETGAFFCAHGCHVGREERKQSMGRLLPGNQLRVIDVDSGEPLGPGKPGELTVRGPTLMERYVKRDRADCFDEDGFFHTGDVGFYDEQGYMHFTGRRTEMIKTAGANVSPAEIEVALRACAPVKLARVLGVDDERRGQQVILCVVLKDGASATEGEIRGFLSERLASYKLPRRVLFFQDGEVPMTASGTKVRDDELRDLVHDRLGINA